MNIAYCFFCVVLCLYSIPSVLQAQEMEPRRWAHLPVNSDIVGFAVAQSSGDISFDPVLKIENGEFDSETIVTSYLRSFDFFGKTARLDFRFPYQRIEWQGLLDGQARKVKREGWSDPLIRLSFNFIGAPALKGKEYLGYRATHKTNTVVGAALGIVLPLGQYKENKLLNIGQNRYVIRPQLGFVHTRGAWSYELTGTVNFYMDNNDFFGGKKKEQEPLTAVQTHVVHTFKNRVWATVSAGYDWGGLSTIDGIKKDDKKENLYYSVSTGYPLSRTSSIKLAYVGSQTQKDIGADNEHFILGFVYRF